MSKFVLTAQLQLQAPTNTRQVVTNIQNQLGGGVTVHVNVKNGKQANKQVKDLANNTNAAADAATKLGRSFAVSFKRFAAFSIATRAVGVFTRSLGDSVRAAVDFERQLIKVSQVTGKSMRDLKGLTDEVTRLATGLGVSSSELLNVSRILAQAGLSANNTKTALAALAKSSLAATFDDITQTAEGAIAILNQFGQGAAALESQLGAINAVAGQFAVESADLIAVIRRTGGVFKAAGGDLNELIALFTSVRSTTRESAESIATGLRTIFTRIQRPKTIQYLQDLGISLTDAEGKFVGAYEAIRILSNAMANMEAGDLKFIEIAEQLGGFRQIGKIIPLLSEFATAERARQVAMDGANSLTEDAATAQGALLVRVTALKEEFLALVRSMTAAPLFQIMANSAISLASALVKVASVLKNILPLITALGAVKIFGTLGKFAGGFGGQLAGAGGPRAFASGGLVPGTGNRDTVPAMLTPGEFVIRKSSVGKIGTNRLSAMNAKGYNKGGKILDAKKLAVISSDPFNATPWADTDSIPSSEVGKKRPSNNWEGPQGKGAKALIGGVFQAGTPGAEAALKSIADQMGNSKSFKFTSEGLSSKVAKKFDEALDEGVVTGVNASIGQLSKSLGAGKPKTKMPDGSALVNAGFKGSLFEEVLAGFNGAPTADIADETAPWDFPQGISGTLGNLYKTAKEAQLIDAKLVAAKDRKKTKIDDEGNITSGVSKYTNSAFVSKATSALTQAVYHKAFDAGKAAEQPVPGQEDPKDKFFGGAIRKYASGGSVSDTVPAMLTPGEFVINKTAARSIGSANLNRMNKRGVTGFAKGGAVGGVQHFANGGGVAASAGMSGAVLMGLVAAIPQLVDKIMEMVGASDDTRKTLSDMAGSVLKAVTMFYVFNQLQKVASDRVAGFGHGMAMSKAKVDGFNMEMLEAQIAAGKKAEADRLAAQASQNAVQVSRNLTRTEKKNLQVLGNKVGREVAHMSVLKKSGATQQEIVTQAKILSAAYKEQRSIMKASLSKSDFDIFNQGLKAVRRSTDDFSQRQVLASRYMQAFAQATKNGASVEQAALTATKQSMSAEKQKVGFLRSSINALKSFSNYAHKAGAGLQTMSNMAMGAVMGLQMLSEMMVQAAEREMERALKDKDFDRARGEIDSKVDAQAMSEVMNMAMMGGMAGMALGPIGVMAGMIGGGLFGMSQTDPGEIRRKEEEKISKAEIDHIRERTSAELKAAQEAGDINMANAGALGDRIGRANELANNIMDEDERKKSIDETNGALISLAMAAGANAKTEAELDAISARLAGNLGEGNIELGKMQKQLINAAKAAFSMARAAEVVAKANYDQLKIISVFNRASVAVDNFANSLVTGSSQLGPAIKLLEETLKNVAMGDIDKGILADARAQAFSALNNAGLGGGSAVGQALGNQFDQLSQAQDFISALPVAMQNMNFSAGQTDQGIKDTLGTNLISNLGIDPNSEMGKIVQSKIDQLKPEDLRAIRSGSFDFSKFLKETSADIAKLGDGALKSLKALQKHEATINKLTKERIKLEHEFMAAQKQAISLQLEAAQIMAEFGGASVTPELRKQAALDKANVTTKRLGLNEIRSGSASELQAISNQMLQNFALQSMQSGAGGFAGNAGLDADRRKELLTAQKELIGTTRELIAINRESLEIIKKKNKLEQDALEAAISGDMEKFLKDSMGVGATAALATGNEALAKALFGVEGLATAFNNIKGMAESGVQTLFGGRVGGTGGLLEQAASAALNARGVNSPRSAQILAGTTPEEEAIKAQQRRLAGTLGNMGENAAMMAEFAVQQAQINVDRANVIFNREMAAGNAQLLSKGGVVYANNGIDFFKPRGTDTVPAMLTPGEGVVSRRGMAAGNNAQMVRAMNRGEAVGGGGAGMVAAIDPAVVNKLVKGLDRFNSSLQKSIDKLNNTKFQIKLDTTNVNVDLRGGRFLANLKDEVKKELLAEVGEKIKQIRFTQGGDAQIREQVL